jgi:hypothetical protein
MLSPKSFRVLCLALLTATMTKVANATQGLMSFVRLNMQRHVDYFLWMANAVSRAARVCRTALHVNI